MARVQRVKIQNKKNPKVSFSKLRLDLFKEATELSALGAKVLLIVFSPNKKVYYFAHPNAEKLIEQFLSRDNAEPQPDKKSPYMEARSIEEGQELYFRYKQLTSKLEVAMKRNAELKEKTKEIKDECLWCQDIDELNKEQLIRLYASLDELQMKLEAEVESYNPAPPVETFCESSSSHGVITRVNQP